MNNPNRVRALIGTFAAANQTGFNRADGSGYAFFADAVLTVDRTNLGSTAARLATAFRSWRSLEPKRQGKARETLLRISAAAGPVHRSQGHRRPHACVRLTVDARVPATLLRCPTFRGRPLDKQNHL